MNTKTAGDRAMAFAAPDSSFHPLSAPDVIARNSVRTSE